ncbi:hypothetical protein NL676_012483 [Syzygium grande]|nr:hypothetical protein NL676_012483 [Syzygium grande]
MHSTRLRGLHENQPFLAREVEIESEFNCTTPLSVSDGTQRGTPTLVLRSLFPGPILAAAAAHGGPDPPARPVAPTTATISAGGASFPSSSRQCSRFIEPPLQVVVVVVPPVTTPAVEFNCRRDDCRLMMFLGYRDDHWAGRGAASSRNNSCRHSLE